MKYCSNCGNKLEEGASFCPECGAKVGSAGSQTGQTEFTGAGGGNQYGYRGAQDPNLFQYAPPAYNQQPYYPQIESNGMAIAGFVCSFFSPLLGWIFGGIGLNKANKLQSGKGKGLAIAALVIATVSFIAGLAIIYSRR